MNSYLGEFINYVNKTYKVIEEPQKTYFQGYFSKSSIVKRLFDEYGDNSSVFEFLKKIDVKIDDINSLEEFGYDNFFNECLFDVNKKNIELYSIKHKTKDYTFSCFMENEKVLRYVMKDKLSSNFFINEIINTADEYIQEDPTFLLMVMYAPSLDESLWSLVIKKLNGEIIDFANVFLMTKSFYQDVERCIGKDSLCRDLIVGNKVKKTWSNLVFSYRQLAQEDYDIFAEYLNESFINDYEKIIQENNINKQLISSVNSFLIFIFENNTVNYDVLEFFIPVLKNENFSIIEFFQEKYIVGHEYDPLSIYIQRKWKWEKCAVLLRNFLNLSFRYYRKYTLLICVLVRTNIVEILNSLNRYQNKQNDNVLNNQASSCVCIYSSLLCNSIQIDGRITLFNNNEFRTILTYIDLDVMKEIVDEWKVCLDKKYRSVCVEKILSCEDIIFSKFKKNMTHSLIFINRLIELEWVEKKWVDNAVKYMEGNRLLVENKDNEDRQKNDQYKKMKKTIYNYLGKMERAEDRIFEEKIIKEIWREFPEAMKDISHVIEYKSYDFDTSRIHPLMELVNSLIIKYELKRHYLVSQNGENLRKILNYSRRFIDQTVFLCKKEQEIINYKNIGFLEKIEECEKDFATIKQKNDVLYEKICALYHSIEDSLGEKME